MKSTSYPVIMATERMFCPEAVPAPLRISPKRLNARINQEVSLGSWAPRCHMLSKLPSQPVFDHSESVAPDTPHTPKVCKCVQHVPATSPLTSPISPPFSSSSGRRAPSRDFSSLFMRSPTLRLQLEKCTCHQTVSARPAQTDRDSIGSGYTSIHTC